MIRGADESGVPRAPRLRHREGDAAHLPGQHEVEGITTSALNLLRQHRLRPLRRHRVLPFTPRSGPDQEHQPGRPPGAGHAPRAGLGRVDARRSRAGAEAADGHGHARGRSTSSTAVLGAEWQRMFGHAQFDHLIDFSGYGNYSPFLFSVAEARRREHLAAQRHVRRHAARDHRREAPGGPAEGRVHLLQALRPAGPVSRELERVNSEKLAGFARPEQFTWAANTMDSERVLHMAGLGAAGRRAKAHGRRGRLSRRAGVRPAGDGQHRHRQHRLDDIDAARALHAPARSSARPAAGLRIGAERCRRTRHVRVGRPALPGEEPRPADQGVREGPRAAAADPADHPRRRRARGPAPRAGAVSLGLSSQVTVAGQVDNPYAIMAECDCFVLSSDYEGQPMVILEARTLGLPVVTTAFSSVARLGAGGRRARGAADRQGRRRRDAAVPRRRGARPRARHRRVQPACRRAVRAAVRATSPTREQVVHDAADARAVVPRAEPVPERRPRRRVRVGRRAARRRPRRCR